MTAKHTHDCRPTAVGRDPDLPTPDEIAIAAAVRQSLLQAAQSAAPIQALAAFIGFGSATFKIQDHRVVRALVETSAKMRGTSPSQSTDR